ncbi:hypothetical protein Daus18300_003390 [Diaporthe australafricana]|uniref:Prolyl 4-hydroxylase alpha subunit Fe(2+) 2OG dioxygenase domain-containing protein n=1 Tax=Diaporthe australafricana TaxID=127596 RepID=A0ABR3XGV7_9PEZI
MSPWESDSEVGASGSDSDGESAPPSGTGHIDAQGSDRMGSKMWKKAFFDKLEDIETFGDFACMTRYSHHINPGLEVAGSLIPLPLVDRDASTIKSKCEQAPFGRGDDTVVDESVRRTWQLDAGLFSCSNPAWPAFLDTVLRETVQKLGMPKGVRAVPWKLLLYEEGSFFKPHKDSEKAPGMIGTLVISLPSEHDGAEVHLSHGNRRHVCATSAFSKFDLTALAWYSDVTHEISPVRAGYRLVMTYNLIQQGGSAPSAGVFIEQQAQLQTLLQNWMSALPPKKKIIYRLDHKYSESSLSIQNMKGRDAQISRCLKQACQETGFYLLLAIMTMRESEDDEGYGNEVEKLLQLDHVATLEGNYLTRYANAEMNEILALTLTRTEVLTVKTKANLLAMRAHRRNIDIMILREAVGFLDNLLENFGSPINETRVLSMVLRACKLWSSQALYNKALRRALMETQRRTTNYSFYQSLMARPNGSIGGVSEAVAEFIDEFVSHPAHQDWNECLGELVHGLDASCLNEAFKVVERRLKTEELKQSFRCWRSSVEASKFETKDLLTALDLSLVLDLIQSHLNDDEWVSTRLLPKLSERAEKQLLYPLLHKLCAEDGYFALKHTESLARRLLQATLPKLNLEIGDLEPGSPRSPQGSIYLVGASNGTDRAMDNVNGFLNLLEDCFMCGLTEQGMELLSNSYENLSEAIRRLPPRDPGRHNTMPYGVP